MDSIRNYLGEKEFRVSEILQFSIMLLLSGFLIGGGIIILNDEDIFKKIYEGYQGQQDTIDDDGFYDTRPIIPDEEKYAEETNTTSTTICNTGYEKYFYNYYMCLQCPDDKPLMYSDGRLISPGEIEISEITRIRCGELESDGKARPPRFQNETITSSTTCRSGYGKYYSKIYSCLKCPNGRILKYSDGTPVSSEEIDTTKLISNENQSGMRCKLPTQAQTSEVVRPTTAAAASQGAPVVSNTWTADLPDDLLLVNLQKNVKLIRKNSLINTITAWTMIVLGSIISIYQIYNLFFS
jgi:hypothetical protein